MAEWTANDMPNLGGRIVVVTGGNASIETFANEFNEDSGRLDVLLNHADIMGTPYGVTRDGFEAQMGTNHLGHFALTGRLLSALKRTARSRVVTVSSSAHRTGTMSFEKLLFRDGRGYTPLKAYGRSKLVNLVFAYELQRRFERHGIIPATTFGRIS